MHLSYIFKILDLSHIFSCFPLDVFYVVMFLFSGIPYAFAPTLYTQNCTETEFSRKKDSRTETWAVELAVEAAKVHWATSLGMVRPQNLLPNLQRNWNQPQIMDQPTNWLQNNL